MAATMRHDRHARRRRRRRYATGERATVLLPPTRTANTGNGGPWSIRRHGRRV